MQNVDLGHTKVIQIRQRETLSHQGVIIHENCCSAALYVQAWFQYGLEFDLATVQPLLLYLQRYIIGEASNKNHSSIVFEQP